MPARTIINASMHQPAQRIAVRFGDRRDPQQAATNNTRRALRAMRGWRNVRNNINDLIMQQRNANSLCACTPDEAKTPPTRLLSRNINKSTSGTYMVRLTSPPCNSPEARAWLKTGREQRAERVPNPVLANYPTESRTHHDFRISPPPRR